MEMWGHFEDRNIRGALRNKYEMEYAVAYYSNVLAKIKFYINPLPEEAIGNVKVFDA